MSSIAVPPGLVRLLREGLHTEFGIAAERIASLSERMGERSCEIYREPWARQNEAYALLEEIGGETPVPPVPIEVDLVVHRPILLRTLREQQRSYAERLDEMEGDEQQRATEWVQDLHTFACAVKRHRPGTDGPPRESE